MGTQIGNRDGASIKFVWEEFAFAGPGSEILHFPGNLQQRFCRRIFYHGGYQAVFNCNSYRHPDFSILKNVIAPKGSIYARNSLHCSDDRLENQVIYCVFVPMGSFCLKIDLAANFHEWRSVCLRVKIEVRDCGLRGEKAFRDNAPETRKLYSLIAHPQSES